MHCNIDFKTRILSVVYFSSNIKIENRTIALQYMQNHGQGVTSVVKHYNKIL